MLKFSYVMFFKYIMLYFCNIKRVALLLSSVSLCSSCCASFSSSSSNKKKNKSHSSNSESIEKRIRRYCMCLIEKVHFHLRMQSYFNSFCNFFVILCKKIQKWASSTWLVEQKRVRLKRRCAWFTVLFLWLVCRIRYGLKSRLQPLRVF